MCPETPSSRPLTPYPSTPYFSFVFSSITAKMNHRRTLSRETREVIVFLHEKALSCARIAKVIGRPRSTVIGAVNWWKKEKRLDARPKSGRPRKTSVRTDRLLQRIVRCQPRESAKVLLHQ